MSLNNSLIAIIDLGSLKMKYTLFENGTMLNQKSYLTLMGKELNENSEISQHSLELLTVAFSQLHDEITSQQKPIKLIFFATEAYRIISNKVAVQNILHTFFPSEIITEISQAQEAELYLKAVTAKFGQEVAAVDVGGGSVQLLVNNADKPQSILLPTGTYKLQQLFSPDTSKLSAQMDQASAYIDHYTSDIVAKSPVLVLGTTCMQDFIFACNRVIDLDLRYDAPHLDHAWYLSIESLQKLYRELLKYTPDSRTHFYPEGGYFIYGAEYLLLNVIKIAQKINCDKIYPTNLNTSYGFLL